MTGPVPCAIAEHALMLIVRDGAISTHVEARAEQITGGPKPEEIVGELDRQWWMAVNEANKEVLRAAMDLLDRRAQP